MAREWSWACLSTRTAAGTVRRGGSNGSVTPILRSRRIAREASLITARSAGVRAVSEDAIVGLFTQVHMIAAQAGLAPFGTIAIDGTKIPENASIDANRGRNWFDQHALRSPPATRGGGRSRGCGEYE